ncbi:hypothetical protein Ctob_015004 [Chrysochromulina tobinii]|uniref:Uncharacterized protein n=1 Tax=Chrysochromulina tobinii TaxID=1460289 RepID=A0A0M0KP08_9EUKA|nr:hypothetical protein Ctob_015004 [Chrysochromulina tobinii]|eukprot:KOO40347.1 hypothetical protein Ctob_015004 [Chrysochromulina sp. CCMP291]
MAHDLRTQLWLRGIQLVCCTRKAAATLFCLIWAALGTMAWSTMLARWAGGSIDIDCLCEAQDGAWWYSCRPQNAVIEAGGQLDRRQRGAVLEGLITDAREASGQRDRRYRGAVKEGEETKACEAGGQRDRRHRGAASEGALTEAGEAGGQRDRRHRGAVLEGVITDAREAGGQLNRRQRGAAIEGEHTDAREAGGQLN